MFYYGYKKSFKTLTGFKKFLLKMNPVAESVENEGSVFYWVKGETKLRIIDAYVR